MAQGLTLAIDYSLFYKTSMHFSVHTSEMDRGIFPAGTLYSDRGTLLCQNILISSCSQMIKKHFPTSLFDKSSSDFCRTGMIPAEPAKYQPIYGQFYTSNPLN